MKERLSQRNREILKQYETVRTWINKKCGSLETAKYYIPNLMKFCKLHKTNPNEIVREWKKVRYDWKERERFLDEWSEKIENYYASMDLAPLTKLGKTSSIISFFRSYKIPIEVQTNRHTYVKYHNRDIHKDELKRILDHSDLRERTFFLVMAESGLRPSTLVQLKYRDIREDFESGTVPMKINVPAEIVKDFHEGLYKELQEKYHPWRFNPKFMALYNKEKTLKTGELNLTDYYLDMEEYPTRDRSDKFASSYNGRVIEEIHRDGWHLQIYPYNADELDKEFTKLVEKFS